MYAENILFLADILRINQISAQDSVGKFFHPTLVSSLTFYYIFFA